MDTKIIVQILGTATITCSLFFTCGQSSAVTKTSSEDSVTLQNKAVIKNYILCKCLERGFKDDSLFLKDHSSSVYSEQLIATYEDRQKLDLFVKKTIDNIPLSDYTQRKGIIYECIEAYNSQGLDSLAKSIADHNRK